MLTAVPKGGSRRDCYAHREVVCILVPIQHSSLEALVSCTSLPILHWTVCHGFRVLTQMSRRWQCHLARSSNWRRASPPEQVVRLALARGVNLKTYLVFSTILNNKWMSSVHHLKRVKKECTIMGRSIVGWGDPSLPRGMSPTLIKPLYAVIPVHTGWMNFKKLSSPVDEAISWYICSRTVDFMPSAPTRISHSPVEPSVKCNFMGPVECWRA